jgi:hypothetical protein
MEPSDFSNSIIYLNKLIEYQSAHNFFSHLINTDEDVFKTITRLYNEDNFQLLFDPVYEDIDNSEIANTSSVYHLGDGSGGEIDCTWLNMVRTENYFYCLIIGSKEKNYALPWFKNKIKDLKAFDLNQKAKEYLLESNCIDLKDYISIEDDELENYDPSDIIDINLGGESWGYYVSKDADMDIPDENFICDQKDGKWGFIDKKGNILIPFEYSEVNDFCEGLARVELDGKWGFIDKMGKIIVPIEYEVANDFSEGFACLELEGKLGFVDISGEIIISFEYEDAHDFSYGFASVKKEGKWGFVDQTGRIKIPLEYDYSGSFDYDGFASVQKDEKWGFIDKTGKIIIPLEYDEVRSYFGGYKKVKKDEKWGFIDKLGVINWED